MSSNDITLEVKCYQIIAIDLGGKPAASFAASALPEICRAAAAAWRGSGSDWNGRGRTLPVTDITEAGTHQARQKLAEAEQKNTRASAALIEALAAAKAMIDEANKRTQDTDTVALLTKLLTEEEVKKVRQDAGDYAKRLLADLDAARDEMNTWFVKAIAADENAD